MRSFFLVLASTCAKFSHCCIDWCRVSSLVKEAIDFLVCDISPNSPLRPWLIRLLQQVVFGIHNFWSVVLPIRRKINWLQEEPRHKLKGTSVANPSFAKANCSTADCYTAYSSTEEMHCKNKKYFQVPFLVLQLITNKELVAVHGRTN